MSSRFTLILVASFWLTMTYLLWRSEYVGKNEVGSPVPVRLVWKKILTAPDNSDLDILRNGKKIGDFHWASKVGQDMIAAKILSEDGEPEGQVERPTNYRLDVQFRLALAEIPGVVDFHGETTLSTNNDWQDFHLKLTVPPTTWNIYSRASEQDARVTEQAKGGPKTERVYKFADFQNPQALMRQFDLPMLGFLGALGPLSLDSPAAPLSLGLQWKARNDWIAFGHTSVRAYRLEATLLERYRMIVIVSRVGEILRVDLPDGWQLLNENLVSL